MILNSKEFENKFSALNAKMTKQTAKQALMDTANYILILADDMPPKTPKKHGALKGSRFVQPVQIHGGQAKVAMGFGGHDQPYARRLHEGSESWHWSEPESGPQYLRSKLVKYPDKIMSVLAQKIKLYGGIK